MELRRSRAAYFTHEVDLDPWSWSVAPSIGGCAFDVSPQNGDRVTGIRALPPSIDVHEYKEQRGGTINVPSAAERKVARDVYRESNRPSDSRRKLSDDEKDEARAERRALREKKEKETKEKYARVFAERDAKLTAELDASEPPNPKPPAHPPPRPKPIDFGMLATLRKLPQRGIPTPVHPPEVLRAWREHQAKFDNEKS